MGTMGVLALLLLAFSDLSAAELFGLDYCVGAKSGQGCDGAKVQLLRLTNAFGRLSYEALGPVHGASAVSTSSALDAGRGIFYYVGAEGGYWDDAPWSAPLVAPGDVAATDQHVKADEGSGASLFGLSTSNGSQVYVAKMPVQDKGLKWGIALDARTGVLYVSGGLEPIPPVNDTSLAWKTVWRHDPLRSGSWTAFSKIKVSVEQMFDTAGVVDTDSETLFLFDHTTVPDQCMRADNIVDLASGAVKGVYCSNMADTQTQVYDPQKKRLFGICATTADYGAMWYYSCWWTPTQAPKLLVKLTDDMAMDPSVSAVDIENRLAFVDLHGSEQLVSLSLDTGEVLESLAFRGGMMLESSPAAAAVFITV